MDVWNVSKFAESNLRVGVRNGQAKYGKICKKNRFCLLDVFKLIARTSKYDFWIPGKILGRSSKKYFEKNIFSR